MTSASAFIAELEVAATQVERLGLEERSRLLQGAASTIRELRKRYGLSDTTVDRPGDVVFDQLGMANTPAAFSAREIAGKLREAASIIRMGQQLLDGNP
jgi:hypothetical protein